MQDKHLNSHEVEGEVEDPEEKTFGDDYTTAFVKTLLRVQNNVINLPGGREHFDIYLAKSIYPTLVPGLEELAREVDRIINSDSKLLVPDSAVETIDASIRERFNPCIYLAEYLMRTNPSHGHKNEYQDIFRKYARIEKLRRFFQMKRQRIYKHFMLQPYQGNFIRRHIKEFVHALDEFLKTDNKLTDNFQVDKLFAFLDENEATTFDHFYDVLSKWALKQEVLDYEDIAKFEDERTRAEEIEAFKKMTDRIL